MIQGPVAQWQATWNWSIFCCKWVRKKRRMERWKKMQVVR